MTKNAGDTVVAPGEALIQVFTATGTWNRPNGVRAARVRVIAGGGGSGGVVGAGTGAACSAGGGGGGYAEQYISAANLLSSETVTVGTGGAAGASGNNAGGTGGTSSFGAHCSATGGTGGAGGPNTTTTNSNTPGNGGAGSGGDLNVTGGAGGYGLVLQSNTTITVVKIPIGGSTPLAGSARISSGLSTPVNGQAYGGGAPGVYALNVSSAGGVGADGVVIVESIY